METTEDAPIKTQVEQHVLVSGELTEAGLRALLSQLHSEISQRSGFTYHQNPTHISIYAYTEAEQQGTGGWVAMLSRTGEEALPEIRVNTEMLAAPEKPEETKLGLTEAQRREYWKESIAAERRAQREADSKYPVDDNAAQGEYRAQLERNGNYMYQRQSQYQAELQTKYGITEAQDEELVSEAMAKNWPME